MPLHTHKVYYTSKQDSKSILLAVKIIITGVAEMATVVKSSDCSFRGSGFLSQLPNGGQQAFIYSDLENPTTCSYLCELTDVR